MIDPATLGVGAHAIWGLIPDDAKAGIIGNRTDAIAMGGFKKLASILSRGSPVENHYILRATQAAYVSAMREMARTCATIAMSRDEKRIASALEKLVRRREFAAFRDDGEHFPLAATNVAIDEIFGLGIGVYPGEENALLNAYDRTVVRDLDVWGVSLPEVFQNLFLGRIAGRAPWHVVFRTAFGNALVEDKQALSIFTVERLGEIRRDGVTVIPAIDALSAKIDEGFAKQADEHEATRELMRGAFAETREVMRVLGLPATLAAAPPPAAMHTYTPDEDERLYRRQAFLEYFRSLRQALHTVEDLWRMLRYQIEAPSLSGTERTYFNVAAVTMLLVPSKLEAFEKIVPALEDHERAARLFESLDIASTRKYAVVLRRELRKFEGITELLSKVIRVGNSINPDHIIFEAAEFKRCLQATIRACGFDEAECADFMHLTISRAIVEQKPCCPMPLDGPWSYRDDVSIDDLALDRSLDLYYSFLDTGYYSSRKHEVRERAVAKDLNVGLAKQIELLAGCLIFARSDRGRQFVVDQLPHENPDLAIPYLLRRYIKPYFEGAADALLQAETICADENKRWKRIASSEDVRVVRLGSGETEVGRFYSERSDVRVRRWLELDGTVRTDPRSAGFDAID